MWAAVIAAAERWGIREAIIRFGPKIASAVRSIATKEGASVGRAAGKRAAGGFERFLVATEGRMGNWAAGDSFQRIPGTSQWAKFGFSPKVSITSAAERFAQKAAWNYLYPESRLSAFAGGFTQGSARTVANFGVNTLLDLALGVPKGIARSPQYIKLIKTGFSEFKRLQGMQNYSVSTLGNLFKSYKKASNMAMRSSRLVRDNPHFEFLDELAQQKVLRKLKALRRYEIAGNITGRLGTASSGYYFLTDSETRDKRINKLKNSINKNSVKREGGRVVRTWVDAHTRQGHHVKGHWRSYA